MANDTEAHREIERTLYRRIIVGQLEAIAGLERGLADDQTINDDVRAGAEIALEFCRRHLENSVSIIGIALEGLWEVHNTFRWEE